MTVLECMFREVLSILMICLSQMEPFMLLLHLAMSPMEKLKVLYVNAAQEAEGVHSVLIAEEIENLLIGPILHDEPILAFNEVLFYGQAIAAVLADSHDLAKKAALLCNS